MSIQVALECRNLQNWSSVVQIRAAFNSAPIHRLKKSFAEIPSDLLAEWKEVEGLTAPDGNYHKLRSVVESCQPPCVPYLGVYLSDLTFIDDGNKDTFVQNGIKLMNITKVREESRLSG